MFPRASGRNQKSLQVTVALPPLVLLTGISRPYTPKNRSYQQVIRYPQLERDFCQLCFIYIFPFSPMSASLVLAAVSLCLNILFSHCFVQNEMCLLLYQPHKIILPLTYVFQVTIVDGLFLEHVLIGPLLRH